MRNSADDERRYRDSRANTSPYGDFDHLPRPPPAALPPPPFFLVGGSNRPQSNVPHAERGSAYQDLITNKNPIKGKAQEEIDDDPHYIEEDAVFEFWLANIWKPDNPIKAQEERKEIVVEKKGWFRGLWSGKK